MIREGQPFANNYKGYRGNAGGMDQGKSYTEGPDNSFDAKATTHYSGYIKIDNVDYFLEFNLGQGLRQMPHLFGLAIDQPVKKDPNDTGCFNSGHTAKTGFLDPIMTYSESFSNGSLYSLTFESAEFVKAYESNSENIASVNVNEYMSTSRDRGCKINELMAKILKEIPEDSVKLIFESILNRTVKDSMLHIYELPKVSCITAEKYRGFMLNIPMYYYEALKSGKSIIHFQNDSPNKADNIFEYNSRNAIDVLYDRTKFPVLNSQAEFRKRDDNILHFKLTLWNADDSQNTKSLYFYPSSDRRQKKIPAFSIDPPSYWESSSKYVTINSAMNIITEEAATDQYRKIGGGLIGSDIQSCQHLRGITTQWAYRNLGKPYWPKKSNPADWGWGDMRNAKDPRCILSIKGDSTDPIQAKNDTIDALKIQRNKHNNAMDECDSMVRIYLALTFGTLVHCYSSTCTGKVKNGRTTPWDLEEFAKFMIDKWVKPPTPPQPTPPQPTPPQPTPPQPTPPQPTPPQPQPIPSSETNITFSNDMESKKICIMLNRVSKATIPYAGQYHTNRDSLMEILKSLGDAQFVKYAQKREKLDNEFLDS